MRYVNYLKSAFPYLLSITGSGLFYLELDGGVTLVTAAIAFKAMDEFNLAIQSKLR